MSSLSYTLRACLRCDCSAYLVQDTWMCEDCKMWWRSETSERVMQYMTETSRVIWQNVPDGCLAVFNWEPA